MMYTAILVAASAAIASAQVTYNSTTGKFTCPASNPNGAFCAGDSLVTNIIIRCQDGVGQPGNCNDNLAGYFPFGVNYAPCFQTSETSGDAACSKNCIIQGGSGNFPGTSTLSGCTPTSQSSTSQPTSSSTSLVSTSSFVPTTTLSSSPSTSPSGSSSVHLTSSSSAGSESTSTSLSSSSITVTTTGITTLVTGGTTITSTYTTTYCPDTAISTLSTKTAAPPATTLPAGTGGPTPPINGTIPTGGSNTGESGAPTATPVGPTASTTTGGGTEFSGAANLNSAGMGLAGLGLMAVYFL